MPLYRRWTPLMSIPSHEKCHSCPLASNMSRPSRSKPVYCDPRLTVVYGRPLLREQPGDYTPFRKLLSRRSPSLGAVAPWRPQCPSPSVGAIAPATSPPFLLGQLLGISPSIWSFSCLQSLDDSSSWTNTSRGAVLFGTQHHESKVTRAYLKSKRARCAATNEQRRPR